MSDKPWYSITFSKQIRSPYDDMVRKLLGRYITRARVGPAASILHFQIPTPK